MRRRFGFLAALLGLLLLPAGALATFPGANGTLAFVRGGDIWTVNADGSGMTQVTGGPATDDNPSWSADGSTITFSRRQGDTAGDIWLVRPGSPPVRFTNTPDFWESYPSWAPDGVHLSFSRSCALFGAEEPECGPYLQMRGTVVVGRIDDPGEYDIALGGRSSWSPDGQRIAFDSGWDAGPLFLANWNGTGVHELPGSDWFDPEVYVGIEFAPSWSPDGTRVAYTRGRQTNGISLTRPDGTEQAHLIPAEGANNAFGPSWSPDGRFIAYSSDADGEVWIMRADGSDRRPITSGLPPGNSFPAWQSLPLPETGPSPGPGVVGALPLPAASSTGGGTTVKPLRLGVRAPRRVPLGRPLVVALRFNRSAKSQLVLLQRRVAGRFTTIAVRRVNGTRPRFRVILPKSGNYVLRVAYRADGRLRFTGLFPVLVPPRVAPR